MSGSGFGYGGYGQDYGEGVSSRVLVVPQSVEPGSTAQFQVIDTYVDGSIVDMSSLTTWSVSNPSVATITNTGLLRTIEFGSVEVTATLGSFTQTVTFSIYGDLNLAPPLIVGNAQTIPFGIALASEHLNVTTSVNGVFSYTPPLGTILPAGPNPVLVSFYPDNTASYAPAVIQVVVNVENVVVSLRIDSNGGYVELGSALSITVYARHVDGTETDVSLQTTFTDPTNSFTGNVCYPNVTGKLRIVATISGISSAFTLIAVPPGGLGVDKQHFSHFTQRLLNYFDANDLRIQTHLSSIDAQLLNIPAQLIEDLELRTSRESSRTLAQCPTNLDNRGIYYVSPLPTSLVLNSANPTLSGVTASINGTSVSMSSYDDRLAAPSSIIVDSNRSNVPFTSPLLFSVEGPAPVTIFDNISLPMPNQIIFWTTGTKLGITNISIHIEGEVYPKSPWHDYQVKTDEVITITQEAQCTSMKKWAQIDKISIRSVGNGEVVTAYSLPIGLPGVLDYQRPYSLAGNQGEINTRYWCVDQTRGLLNEYYASDFGGLEFIQSTISNQGVTALAVEPWAYGIFVLSNNTLYYGDRRQEMPANLDQAGIQTEPAFGLQVTPYLLNTGMLRLLNLEPLAFGRAQAIINYRYTVETPDGTLYCLDSLGNSVPYTEQAGWQDGAPSRIKYAITAPGTYVFTIECIDYLVGNSHDSVPWNNLEFRPLAFLSLDSITNSAKDLFFDSWGDLWVWDGNQIIPVVLQYQNYVLDYTNNRIFFTTPVDSVVIS